jgi:hypothetical protein
VQCGPAAISGDGLLNEARWTTSLIFHRAAPELRFDETLFAGEDAHFAQCLLQRSKQTAVPIVTEPLVDIYQDGPLRPRTNLLAEANWRAARRCWWQFGRAYSPRARRLFVLRSLAAREKMGGRPGRCLVVGWALLKQGGWNQARFAANAALVAAGWGRGRFVT